MIVGGLTMATTVSMTASENEGSASFFIGMLVFYLIFGIIAILIGRGFRKLKPWVRIPGTIFAALGLLSIPIGTLINGYILYLMFSAKGKMVFSPEYSEIREATPEVVYKTSALSWIILIGLVVGLVALISYFSMQ